MVKWYAAKKLLFNSLLSCAFVYKVQRLTEVRGHVYFDYYFLLFSLLRMYLYLLDLFKLEHEGHLLYYNI